MRMSARVRWTRMLAGAALAMSIAVPTVAPVAAAASSPAAAGSGHTWVVDDDGRATPDRCSAKAEAPKRIQKAIDSARAGDTILVCPGLYREQLTITGSKKAGLTVRGISPWAAVVQPPNVTSAPQAVRIAATKDVTIQWLRFLTPDAAPGCINVSRAIVVDDGRDVTIRANRFAPGKADPSGPCRFQNGIDVAGRSRVRILYNLLRDATGIYVFAGEPTVSLRIARNSFRSDSATEGFVGVVANTAHAAILDNRFTGGPSMTSSGLVMGAPRAVEVRHNRFRQLAVAIQVMSGGDARIIDNRIAESAAGILTVSTIDAIVRANRITADGTDVACSSNGDVNATWVDNLRTGGFSGPEEICPLAP